MENGWKNILNRVWNVLRAVNTKKGRLAKEAAAKARESVTPDQESTSKPQNFHKKPYFPSFTDGKERNYPSFKRKWKAIV